MDAWNYTTADFKEKAERENSDYHFIRLDHSLTTGLWCDAIMQDNQGHEVKRRMYF
jgi:hypothetical protein